MRTSWLSTACVLACAAPAHAQAIFRELVVPSSPGSTAIISFRVQMPDTPSTFGANENFGFVPGFINNPAYRTIRWSGSGPVEAFGWPTGMFTSQLFNISGDGSTLVGSASSNQADGRGVVWRNGTAQILPDLSSNFTSRFSTSAVAASTDGSVIVGTSMGPQGDGIVTIMPTVWINGAATSPPFPTPPSGFFPAFGSRILDVSDNGQVIVGTLTWRNAQGVGRSAGWRYSYSTNAHRTTQCTGGVCPGIVNDVSGDGSVSFGTGQFNDGNTYGFYWTATGLRTLLPRPLNAPTNLLAVVRESSFDGTVAAGSLTDTFSGSTSPVIWRGNPTSGYTATYLTDELVDAGYDLSDWQLFAIEHVSADGRTFIGQGQNNGQAKYWIAHLPGPDTDGDGLADSWESQGGGIDINLDGVIDLDLYALGARPNRKDLFVEVDAMDNPICWMTDRTKSLLEQAFASAPVSNPDGSTGITLHIQRDDTTLPFTPTVDMSNGFPPEFESWKSILWGTAAERGSPNAANILLAKARAFRYAMLVSAAPDGSSIVGRGECPGNDSISAFGEAGFHDGVRDNLEMAALFMHEFGHNLGLGHGGVNPTTGEPDDTNAKPNYPSIMNYVCGFPDEINLEFWRLDFSREELAPLDESALNESVGIASSLYQNYQMPIIIRPNSPDSCELGRTTRWTFLTGTPVDYNRDANFNTIQCGLPPLPCGSGCGPFCDTLVETSAQAPVQCGPNCYRPCPDLNFNESIAHAGQSILPSPGEVLLGCNDWARMTLSIGVSGSFAPGPPLPPSFPEPTFNDIAAFQASLPPAPRRCPPDIDGGIDDYMPDGVLSVTDIFSFLNAWFAQRRLSDFDRSGVIEVTDIFAYLNAWFAGCP